MTLAEIYWEASKDTEQVSKDNFLDFLRNFSLQPIIVRNETVGCIATRGNEIHVGVKKEYRRRWVGKWFIRLLHEMAEKYGEVVTYAYETQADAVRFIQKLGFELKGKTGGILMFALRRRKWD